MEYVFCDLQNLTSIFEFKDYPKIFLNFAPNKSEYENLTNILNIDYETKPLDDFFENYISSYPFDKKEAINCLKKIESSKKIQLLDIFLLWFPQYFFFI